MLGTERVNSGEYWFKVVIKGAFCYFIYDDYNYYLKDKLWFSLFIWNI